MKKDKILIDGKKFDSYMIPTEDLEEGNLRLLEVDNRLLLPVNLNSIFPIRIPFKFLNGIPCLSAIKNWNLIYPFLK